LTLSKSPLSGGLFEIPKMFYLMGWDEWDGMDGTEYQKCPLIFFILCMYIDKVYTYLYRKQKIAANILMGFKI